MIARRIVSGDGRVRRRLLRRAALLRRELAEQHLGLRVDRLDRPVAGDVERPVERAEAGIAALGPVVLATVVGRLELGVPVGLVPDRVAVHAALEVLGRVAHEPPVELRAHPARSDLPVRGRPRRRRAGERQLQADAVARGVGDQAVVGGPVVAALHLAALRAAHHARPLDVGPQARDAELPRLGERLLAPVVVLRRGRRCRPAGRPRGPAPPRRARSRACCPRGWRRAPMPRAGRSSVNAIAPRHPNRSGGGQDDREPAVARERQREPRRSVHTPLGHARSRPGRRRRRCAPCTRVLS